MSEPLIDILDLSKITPIGDGLLRAAELKDVTFYWERTAFIDYIRDKPGHVLYHHFKPWISSSHGGKIWGVPKFQMPLPAMETFEGKLRLKFDAENKKSNDIIDARACLCACHQQEFVSGTFRCEEETPTPNSNGDKPKNNAWMCATHYPDGCFQNEDLAKAIWSCLRFSEQGNGKPPSGLILVAGSTNSAKSNIAQAIALQAIRMATPNETPNNRMPHLVTYEDPIEGWKIGRHEKDEDGEPLDSPKGSFGYGFCLTAREGGKDAKSLKQALSDARRQTPACFYVGEVRELREWRPIVDFAGTGHLVVVTTHAATLTETVSRLLTAVDARTAAGRREVGSRLLGAIHLRKEDLKNNNEKKNGDEEKSEKKEAVFPTMWAQKGAAVNDLVAVGLSSITPNQEYVFGRKGFLVRSRSMLVKSGDPKTEFLAACNQASDMDTKELGKA